MSTTPYFHSEALRQRFQRHLKTALTERRITDQEYRYLQVLGDTGQAVVDKQDSVELYRLTLEDGSPESLGMVTALVIERWTGSVQVLYLDTLADGLRRFTDRKQLSTCINTAFGVGVDQSPAFQIRLVEEPLFHQRMWQIIDHQAQTLSQMAADLQELPTLARVLERLLAPRIGSLWPRGNIDLRAPLVQIVEHMGSRHGANRENPVRVQSVEELAMDILTGKTLPAGQRYRFMGLEGQPMGNLDVSSFGLQMASLEGEYEYLVGEYWHDSDRYGITRRQRFAQALADVFSHQIWMLQPSTPSLTGTLNRIAATPLYTICTVKVSRLSLTCNGQGPYKLASLYLIHLEHGALVLYSPLKGVRRLKDRKALNDLFNSPTGRSELRNYLSLNDLEEAPVLTAGPSLRVNDYPLDKPLFHDCIDAIIGLQERNLAAALRYHCRDEDSLRAMLDDALDIRALLDGCLPWIGSGGRWLNGPTDFKASWSHASLPKTASGPVAVMAQPWGEQLNRLEGSLREICSQRPFIEVLARQILSPYLAVIGYPRPHEGQHIRLVWSERGACTGSDASVSCGTARDHDLTDLVLEYLSGARIGPLPPGGQVRLPADLQGAEGTGAITAQWLESVISRAATALLGSCTARFEGFHDQALRIAKAQKQVSQTLHATREQLLRLELIVARRRHDITPSLLDLLQTVLDRPMSSMRHGRVDVHALKISIGGRQFAPGLDVIWALQLADHPEHNLLFWSPFIGLKAMDSRVALQAWLQARLAEPEWRSRWLSVFPGDDRQWIDKMLAGGAKMTLSLEQADGDFLRHMQHDARQREGSEFAAALRDARQHRLAAKPFKSCLDLVSNEDWLLTWLDAMAVRVQNLLFTSAMPDWVNMASLEDLDLYTDLLQAFFRHNDPAHDFLADVPPLQIFVQQRVQEVLKRDFADHELDPNTITVIKTSHVAAPALMGQTPSSIPATTLTSSENLVDFSLNHFSHFKSGVLSVHLPEGTPVPAGLDGHYVARLVHDLDVGLRYQTLLATCFDPGKPEFAARRERFMRQMPSRLLVTVMEMKLQGLLSQTAFDFIERLLDMPDDVARQPVHGQHIVLRPLSFIPRAGMAADTVEGFFLIGPQDLNQGPLILHIQFSEWFSFREFRDQEHLLTELRVEGPLQELLLSRLEPRLRDRYGNGGLREAHLRFPAQGTQWIFDTTLERAENVTLGTQVIKGNVLHYLFDTTVQLMQSLSRKQTVTSAQDDWATFVNLMGLLAEQVLIFAPGKLGLLISLWQAKGLVGKSVSAASERQWGEALGEFTVALGVLVTSRREETEPLRSRSRSRVSNFSWRHSALSTELRSRLVEFEVLDVELSSLQFDALYNLYQDPLTQTRYAAVEGKVYRVHQVEGAWRIKGNAGDGPSLQLDSKQTWQLRLELGLRGGMPTASPSEQAMQTLIDQYITVRAEGMKNIRLYSREEARKINMARFQALGYLKNALLNLNAPVFQGLASPVQEVLSQFFGVETATPLMIDDVRQRFSELFVGLAEPSLGPLSSGRFVLGASRMGYESMAAFVLAGDPRRRVFLNDLFFTPPDYNLKKVLPNNRAFSSDDHFRASILIHEMSHQICETVDFAYLDASAPPAEMIDDSLPEWSSYKTQLQNLREKVLSHRTPSQSLFLVSTTDGTRDMQPKDSRLFGKLIRLTGEQSLEQARHAFLSDPQVRSRVILGNADSVAMLASLLGRERFS